MINKICKITLKFFEINHLYCSNLSEFENTSYNESKNVINTFVYLMVYVLAKFVLV